MNDNAVTGDCLITELNELRRKVAELEYRLEQAAVPTPNPEAGGRMQRDQPQKSRPMNDKPAQSDRLYRTLVETARDIIWTLDLDMRYTYVSPSVTQVLGFTVEEIMGMHPLDCVTPESRASALAAFQEEMEREAQGPREIFASRIEEIERYHKDGSLRWHELTMTFLRDEEGKPTGVLGISHDVTERKRMETALVEARNDLENRIRERTDQLLQLNVLLRQEIESRERTSEDLLRAKTELHAIYENCPIMMCVLDGQRRVLYANRAFVEFVGKNEQELREGRACGVFGCSNALDDPRGCGFGPHCEYCALRLAIEDTYETGASHREVEYRATLIGSASTKHVVLLGSTAPIELGDKSTVLLCLEDVTEREKVHAALRESEERYRGFFETSQEAVFITTLEGRFVDFNDAALELIGYEPSERDILMAANVSSLYANPDERTAHAVHVADLGFSKEFPLDLCKRDGTIIKALATSVARKDPTGAIIGFQGTIRDITAQKKAEEELRNTFKRFYTILSSLYAGVLIVTDEGRVEFVNQAFCDLFDLHDPPESLCGLPSPEMIARVKDVYADPAFVVTRIQKLVADNLPLKGEPIDMRGGRTYLVDYVPLVVDGKSSGRVWHHNDVTELKKAEAERERLRDQLLHSQKLESLGTLAGGIAHDFNNLLTVINGFTELILMERTADDPIYPDLQKILATGQKGADLVQMLLTFGKKADIKPAPLDLNSIISSSVNLMTRTFPKMIAIETILDKDLATVNADASQIEQLVMNLCINAKEAMPDGGTLRVETRDTVLDETQCNSHHGARPGHYVFLEISDTGTGMDKATMDRIFDPFFTTKGWDFNKGTGLGLSVAKGIAEQHGGWISCQSNPGQGTIFTVSLPAIDEASSTNESKSPAGPAPRMAKILLVDDEEYVRDLGKRILERSGFTVITAADCQEALEACESEKSDIALVVLDLIMPQKGGEQCLEELLLIKPDLKVVISTGHSLPPAERARIGQSVKNIVQKPYRLNELLEVVKALMEA